MTAHANLSKANKQPRQPVVLIVEDESLLRSTTAEYLRLSGYAVIEAADAAEAVAVLTSGEAVDIIFTDVQLPGSMDGVKLAGWVHRHHRDTPVMLTSGHSDATSLGELAGNVSFAAKPYRQKELARRIRLLLQESGAR